MVNLSPKTALALFLAARPTHWIKNLGISAALVFSGLLFNKVLFMRVFWAFWVFNLATSSTYLLNDCLDAKQDKLHPIKAKRPVASGKLPIPTALLAAAILATFSIIWAYTISNLFFWLVVAYLFLQIAYSTCLKNIPVLDILVIATGFIIRIYSGAFIIDAHLSVWFLLCVISVSLFLASGKRRAELGTASTPEKTRKSLSAYPVELLNSYVTMFGNAAWMSWSLFTFFESPKATIPLWLVLAEISRTTTINKLLMITIPVTIFGIMRYEALIFQGGSEAPEKLLLTDRSLVSAVFIWIAMIVWILYGGATSIHPI